MKLKEKIRNFKYSDWLIARYIYQLSKYFQHRFRLFTNEKYRSEYIGGRKFKDHYHQRSSYTYADRYPLIFATCKQYFRTVQRPRILSFGCATGEEVFTLGKYISDAVVIGVDINEWCIEQCRKKNTNNKFSFWNRFSETFIQADNFDAIFCMAVFQRTENRFNLANIAQGLTFEQFEQELSMLDKKLKIGGLLIVDHSDFSFSDTACSIFYKPLDFEFNQIPRTRPLFDRHNKKISATQNIYRVFVKQEAGGSD